MSNNGKIKVTKKTPHSMYGNVLNTDKKKLSRHGLAS